MGPRMHITEPDSAQTSSVDLCSIATVAGAIVDAVGAPSARDASTLTVTLLDALAMSASRFAELMQRVCLAAEERQSHAGRALTVFMLYGTVTCKRAAHCTRVAMSIGPLLSPLKLLQRLFTAITKSTSFVHVCYATVHPHLFTESTIVNLYYVHGHCSSHVMFGRVRSCLSANKQAAYPDHPPSLPPASQTPLEADVEAASRWLVFISAKDPGGAGDPSVADQRLVLETRHPSVSATLAWLDTLNTRVMAQHDDTRSRYLLFAAAQQRRVPVRPPRKAFVFHAGADSPGKTIVILKGATVNQLALLCSTLDECVAFTTDGRLKSKVLPSSQWKQIDPPYGLYVVGNMDVCGAGAYTCPLNAECSTTTGRAEYSCACNDGFTPTLSELCIPVITPDSAPDLHRDPLVRLDMAAIVNTAAGSTGNYVFVPQVDSFGGDIAAVDVTGMNETGRAASLKAACDAVSDCIAVTTSGYLKNALAERKRWTKNNSSITAGMWVLDINYCALPPMGCPRLSECTRVAAAAYNCVLRKGANVTTPLAPSNVGTVPRPANKTPPTTRPPVQLPSPGNKQSNEHVHPALARADPGPQPSSRGTAHAHDVPDDEARESALAGAPAVSTHGLGPRETASSGIVTVAIFAEPRQYRSAAVLIRSLIQHAQSPEMLRVHLFDVPPTPSTGPVPRAGRAALDPDVQRSAADLRQPAPQPTTDVLTFLRCRDALAGLPVTHVVHQQVNASWLGQLSQLAGRRIDGSAYSVADVAPLFLADLLPHADRVLHLDPDMIVLADVATLFSVSLRNADVSSKAGHPRPALAAAVNSGRPLRDSLPQADRIARFSAHLFHQPLDLTQPAFTATMVLYNLARWREVRATQDVFALLDMNRAVSLWKEGAASLWKDNVARQVLFLIVASVHGWHDARDEWSVAVLGGEQDVPGDVLARAKVVQWGGEVSPWVATAAGPVLWHHYDAAECSGHGSCEGPQEAVCVCARGFGGPLCTQGLGGRV